MYITKVKLKEKGISGAEITFIEHKDKSGRMLPVEVTETPPHPVHQGLINLFEDLRYFILEIYETINEKTPLEDKQSLLYDTEVDEITMQGEYIILSGKRKIFGDKYLKLKTPKLEETDEYPKYEKLVKLKEEIEREAKEYLTGSKKVTNEEIILKWAKMKNRSQINEDSIKTFTPEELKKMSDDIANKRKVTLPDIKEFDESELDKVVVEPVNIDVTPAAKKDKKGPDKVIEVTPSGKMYLKKAEE